MMAAPTAVIRRMLWILGLGSVLIAVLMLGSGRGEAALVALQTEGSAEVYARHCAPCHGATGEGSDFGPAVAGSQLPVDDRIAIITNGTEAMPAFGPTLSPDQIAQLATFSDPLFAGGLYLQQCGPCHGAAGEGGVGPSLQTSTLSEADSQAIIRDGSLVMPAFGPTLAPEQIEGLVSFVATLVDDSAPPVDGAAVYAERCASCHGSEGEGGAGPSLQASTTSLADQVAIIGDGRGGMPAYGSVLSAAELDAVAAVSAGWQRVPPEDPIARGAQVYADSCSECHGVDGVGGIGPNLRSTALARDDLIAAVVEGKGTMPSFGGQITAGDVEAVVTFLEDLAEPADPTEPSLVAQGAELFASNCSRCHGPDASGGVGPALKNSPLTDVEMVSVISNGRGTMPAFSEILTSASTTALVAYVESTRAAGGGSDPLSAVEHGREIYVSSCATCHGLDGLGGVGPSLANTRLSANEIISQVFGIHADRMPAFEGLLDPAQVQDVARYVLTVEGGTRSQVGWLVAAVVAVLSLAGLAILWYGGFLDQLAGRLRKRPT